MRFPTRRVVVLGLVLALAALVMPNASVRVPDASLVKVQTAQAVDHPRSVVWILCLGSDARPGQRLTGTRADAIQLVGLNLDTGHGTIIPACLRSSSSSRTSATSPATNAARYPARLDCLEVEYTASSPVCSPPVTAGSRIEGAAVSDSQLSRA